MRSPIAARSQGIPPSATVRIADVVSDMRRRGIDIVDFSAGRAAEHTPAYVIEAATRAMQKGDTHQTPAQGKPEFRKACAQKLARDNGIEADPERELIATLGCKQGLFLGLQATLDPGDEVLVEDPGFVSYQPEIQYCGGRAVAVPLPWTVEALMEKRTSKTRGLVLCSPQNPTGVVHRREDLEAIAGFAKEHDLLVYSDETYERLTWDGHEHLSIASLSGMRERTVTLMGLTKSFSMGGWRVGFALAPEFEPEQPDRRGSTGGYAGADEDLLTVRRSNGRRFKASLRVSIGVIPHCRAVLKLYVTHHHHESNHQGRGNVLLFPIIERKDSADGPIRSRERRGGRLRSYDWEAARVF